MNTNILNVIALLTASAMALIAVRWAYFKILYIAKEKKLVDNPDARKLQKEPIPVLGGIAVFFGVAMGLLAGYTVGGAIGVEFKTLMMPVLAAMVVMLYTGALDDIMGLTPKARFIIEIAAVVGLIYAGGGCIDTFHGLWGVQSFSWWLAVPLTVFAGVGIINAVNMIDGVNGLSSTLCMLNCVLYGCVFLRAGDSSNSVLAFSTAAALLPFMVHNIFGLRSRMFIGDAGTMVMGLLMTWFTISLLRSDSPYAYYNMASGINMIAFAVAVLCVPVFDTLRVMGMRMAKKKSPFHPDKTHLHHVFVKVGVSHFITAMTEILIMLTVVVIWWISVMSGLSVEWQLYIVILAAIVFVWGTYWVINYHAQHHTRFLHFLVRFNVKTHLGRTCWWKRFTTWLDKPESRLKKKLEAAASKERPVKEEVIDPFDLKEEDRKMVLDFMKGRAEVMVFDIIEHSGANRSLVHQILYEEVQDKRVKIIRFDAEGKPEIVALN